MAQTPSRDAFPRFHPTPRPPKLDERLRAAADWVEPCDVCADIGCDHGRLGAVLLWENRCGHLLAADVSAKAIEKARERITTLGLAGRTSFAVADGLDALAGLPNGRADVICILGMGGDTLSGILRRGMSRLQGATLILGAQTELYFAREALQNIGYRLTGERVVHADGRMYILMRAQPASADAPRYTERELRLGPCLLRELPITWQPWLERKQRLLNGAVRAMRDTPSTRNAQRLAEAERELDFTKDALEAMRGSKGDKGEGRR